uniref:Uncharacterized protein n=1 Tax=Nelumbo nucifera TaxID=4432 RepID=A0A822ZSY9_NELNU|nr:TPA_asm: hypothetical protein HUJ06_017970 [Nelumbo nucifera]
MDRQPLQSGELLWDLASKLIPARNRRENVSEAAGSGEIPASLSGEIENTRDFIDS